MASFAQRPCEVGRAEHATSPAVAGNSSGTWALVAAIVGSSMSFIDGTAVNVALPILQRDLGATSADVQWVVEGYSLFLSALILIGGSLGDVFGRRFVYGAGIALFAVASIGCALAPNVEFLIVARCVQGIGGAFATPGSLALISASFSGEARGRAIGTWSGFSTITSVIGPVLGGWLVQLGSWRWVFIINVPLAAIVLVILVLRVGESRDESASKAIDVLGATLATGGLGALVFGLIRLQGGSLDGLGVVAAALGVAALAGFVVAEKRRAHPMVRLDLFASRRFSAANLYTFLLYAALGGSLYFVPFDLINVQHYAPSAAGAALLPMILIMFTLSRFSGGLVARIGPRLPLAIGAVLAAAGFTIFAFAGVGHSYWATFFPGAIVLDWIGRRGFRRTADDDRDGRRRRVPCRHRFGHQQCGLAHRGVDRDRRTRNRARERFRGLARARAAYRTRGARDARDGAPRTCRNRGGSSPGCGRRLRSRNRRTAHSRGVRRRVSHRHARIGASGVARRADRARPLFARANLVAIDVRYAYDDARGTSSMSVIQNNGFPRGFPGANVPDFEPAVAGDRSAAQTALPKYDLIQSVFPSDAQAPAAASYGGYGGYNDGGGLSGFSSVMNGFLSGLQNLIASLSQQFGLGNAGGTSAAAGGQQYFANATAGSTGDPHESFTATTGSGSNIDSKWDSMQSHNDMLDSDSFNGGYRVSTVATQPNAKGVSMNDCATITTGNGATQVRMNEDGSYGVSSNGQSVALQTGQAMQLGNGESVTLNADNSLTERDSDGSGGTISTTLRSNGQGGVDVSMNANDVDLGGYLVKRSDVDPAGSGNTVWPPSVVPDAAGLSPASGSQTSWSWQQQSNTTYAGGLQPEEADFV